MRIRSERITLVDTLRWLSYINVLSVIGRNWRIDDMELTEVFTATGVEGDENSLWFLFPEHYGKDCPVIISGERLLERSPFICNDDDDIVLRRLRPGSETDYDLTLHCTGPTTWFLEWGEDFDMAYLGSPVKKQRFGGWWQRRR